MHSFSVCLAILVGASVAHSQTARSVDEYLSRNETSPFCATDSEPCPSSDCWTVENDPVKCTMPLIYHKYDKCGKPDCGITVETYQMDADDAAEKRMALNITFPSSSSSVWLLINRTDSVECRHISKKETKVGGMSHDCYRDIAAEVDKTISLTVVANRQMFKGTFGIPSAEESGNRSIFFYYHDYAELPTVTFQANDEDVQYSVAIRKLKNGRFNKIVEKLVNISNPETYQGRNGSLFTVRMGRTLLSGNHRIEIMTRNCSAKTCERYSYLDLVIVEPSSSTIIVISQIIMAILILCFVVSLLVHRQQMKYLEPIPGSMLLTFNPVSASHAQTVQATRIFLRKLLGMDVLLDVSDMPKSGHDDPVHWYQDALDKVNFLGFVVPPTESSDSVQTLSLYLELLEKRCSEWPTTVRASYLIMLDDSDKNLIPKYCQDWPRFHCPRGARLLRQHLQFRSANKKNSCFRLPPSLLPLGDVNDQLFDEILDSFIGQGSELQEVVLDPQPSQHTEASDPSSTEL